MIISVIGKHFFFFGMHSLCTIARGPLDSKLWSKTYYLGSGQSLILSPKVREKFGRGLINAVLSTEAWVITSGIDIGISKEVGDAVKKYAVGKANDIKEKIKKIRKFWKIAENSDFEFLLSAAIKEIFIYLES